jgi:hypothetical protein
MQTDYVDDVHHWDEGQRAYKFGVILILPPEPIFSQVNELRARYDPISQTCCDAHISLTMPLPRAPTDAQWAEIEAVTSSMRPFTVHYGPLMTYPPHPGVVPSAGAVPGARRSPAQIWLPQLRERGCAGARAGAAD